MPPAQGRYSRCPCLMGNPRRMRRLSGDSRKEVTHVRLPRSERPDVRVWASRPHRHLGMDCRRCVVGPCYGRLGACDGGGVKPGTIGGAAGAVVCGGVALFDATRVGPCPTPKAKPRPRIITRHVLERPPEGAAFLFERPSKGQLVALCIIPAPRGPVRRRRRNLRPTSCRLFGTSEAAVLLGINTPAEMVAAIAAIVLVSAVALREKLAGRPW